MILELKKSRPLDFYHWVDFLKLHSSTNTSASGIYSFFVLELAMHATIEHSEAHLQSAVTETSNCFHRPPAAMVIAAAIGGLRSASERGSAPCRYLLGRCFEFGVGIPKDPCQALELYRSAAEAGHVGASKNVGICLWNGKGLPMAHLRSVSATVADRDMAIQLFTNAADRGNSAAAFMLMHCYLNGEHVKESRDQAKLWLQKACGSSQTAPRIFQLSELLDTNLPPSQYSLGFIHEMGIGCPFDLRSAIAHYSLAADAEHKPAQWYIGCCYERGKGVRRDLHEAIYWHKRAVATLPGMPSNASVLHGHQDSFFRLGRLYESGLGLEMEARVLLQEAVGWYKKAVEAKHGLAANRLATLYSNGVITKSGETILQSDEEEALRWHRAAADLGEAGSLSYIRASGDAAPSAQHKPTDAKCRASTGEVPTSDARSQHLATRPPGKTKDRRRDADFNLGTALAAVRFLKAKSAMPVGLSGFARSDLASVVPAHGALTEYLMSAQNHPSSCLGLLRESGTQDP